ncbi:hypothetical protein VDG1235_52 [Verrucomicrobiia bacterium DG1235]|nr:hypothetical protein VDG1235_52 [Verrucomicrobiae bacterium DG1235]
MEIEAKSDTTIPELLEGRNWHWKKHGRLQYWWYVAGVIFIFFGISFAIIDESVFAVYLFIFGTYCILRKKFLEYRFRKSMGTSPAINKQMVWRFKEDGFTQESELGNSKLKWSSVFQSYSTPIGFLIYPQKNLYYWIPRSGFSSHEDYDEVAKLLHTKTQNRNIV